MPQLVKQTVTPAVNKKTATVSILESEITGFDMSKLPLPMPSYVNQIGPLDTISRDGLEGENIDHESDSEVTKFIGPILRRHCLT